MANPTDNDAPSPTWTADADDTTWRPPPAAELVLESEEAQAELLELEARALERARLNEHYPPARALAAQLRGLSPRAHLGLYPRLHLDVRTGLPTYREWTRVHTDAEMSARVLAELPPRAELEALAQAAPHTIWARQLVKHHYHTTLAQLLPRSVPASQMQVQLRRVDAAERRAWLLVVLDKLDASGLYVRITVELSQQSPRWRHAMLALDAEAARETEALRAALYRLSGLDAEFTFVQLAALDGLSVERVIKGTIGPFFVAGTNVPQDLASLFAPHDRAPPGRGPLLATFGLDMAGCDIARDADNDPLEDLLTERLSETGRESYLEARARLGYHVFKDRKLVVSSPDLVAPLQDFCSTRGSRNVIHTLRG